MVLIIGYKFAKGALWLVLAMAIFSMVHTGLSDQIEFLATRLRHHTQAWSIYLGELIERGGTERGLRRLALALLGDGALSLVEGWALYHGHWWGPWLVVAVTASLTPFELVFLVRRPSVLRALLLALNLGIVWYLARAALAERRHPDRK